MHNSEIEHEGIVVAKELGLLVVEIEVLSACGSCDAKSGCRMAESGSRCISVKDHGDHHIGDRVVVIMEERRGAEAVLLAYVWPFIFLMTALVLGVKLLDSEVLAGLVAIILLGPYFLTLYFFRDRIKKKFLFRLKS